VLPKVEHAIKDAMLTREVVSAFPFKTEKRGYGKQIKDNYSLDPLLNDLLNFASENILMKKRLAIRIAIAQIAQKEIGKNAINDNLSKHGNQTVESLLKTIDGRLIKQVKDYLRDVTSSDVLSGSIPNLITHILPQAIDDGENARHFLAALQALVVTGVGRDAIESLHKQSAEDATNGLGKFHDDTVEGTIANILGSEK